MKTLAVLLAATLPATLPNLDFAEGKGTHWEGSGFDLQPRGGVWQASSADRDGKGRTALLHRTFLLPRDASALHFRAAWVRPDHVLAGGTLDVVLEAAGREILPRQVRDGDRWIAAGALLPLEGGNLREYVWNVESHAGRRVRIALIDQDARPGCHVVCTGFTLVSRDESNARRFQQDMQAIVARQRLPRMSRFDSKHFLAFSNANLAFTEYRLHNCETIYPAFFRHFRRRGFVVREPVEKLMVAIFDTQTGFEAYLGTRVSSTVTGLYHLPSNRLVVYDYASNRDFVSTRKRVETEARQAGSDLERERRIVTLGRWVRDRRDDTNISTIMHETAHQLSFNTGLLNRQGDVPMWLAEGLAVYCEATIKGSWQGIGESNPQRAAALADVVRERGTFLSLRTLVTNDDWLRRARDVDQIVLGYSQSWALFRLLVDERPAQLRAYLKTIHPRRTPEHRLGDFAAAFGDLDRLQKRYQDYLRELARHAPR